MSEQPFWPAQPLVVRAPAAVPPARAITSREEFAAPGVRLVSFALGEMAELTEHSASRPAIVQMISGECDFQLGRDTHHLQAGDVVWMPPGTRHALRARGPMMMWLILFGGFT